MVIILDCLSRDGSSILPRIASFVVVLASEVTLARFLRRTKSVEGHGFDARLIGRSGYMVAYRLDESQVTYQVLARALCK